MILFAILILAALAAANRYVGKSVLYPPTLFSILWAVFLLLVCLSGKTFYPIGGDTLLFYVWGACALSAGGLAALLVFSHAPKIVGCRLSETRRRAIHRFLDMILVVLVLVLPFYWHRIEELAGAAVSSPGFWIAVRAHMIEYYEEQGARSFSILDNCVVLSSLVALVAYCEDDGSFGRQIRTWVSIFVSIVYNLMTASRAGTAVVLLSLVGMNWIRAGRLNWKHLAVVAVLCILVFSSMAILLSHGEVSRNATLQENIPALIEDMQLYALGGIVAFDQILHDPHEIPAVWKINREFLLAANKLGANFNVPSLHAGWVSVGPGVETNVYTFYFSYFPDFGVLGTTLIVGLLGGALTWVYQAASRRDPRAVIFYGILFSGLLFSVYNEQFFLGLNFMMKAALFVYVLYKCGTTKASDPGTHSVGSQTWRLQSPHT